MRAWLRRKQILNPYIPYILWDILYWVLFQDVTPPVDTISKLLNQHLYKRRNELTIIWAFPMMTFSTKSSLLSILLLSFLWLATACAPMPVPRSPTDPVPVSSHHNDEPSWWIIGFVIHWPEKAAIRFYMDELIAHKIVQPVLRQQQQNIRLWRFHRRAARDPGGHRFSFHFYASEATAVSITTLIRADTLLNELIADKKIDQVAWPDPNRAQRPLVEANSDTIWPLSIQKTWPYFIQGVSDTWLRLVDNQVLELRQKPLDNEGKGSHGLSSIEQELAHYQAVHERVTVLWRQFGGHAYLHHLNAVFGYEKTLLRF